MNIWEQLPKPFFALAPMDDVTDTVFRRIVSDTAPPDVYFTEFANADGLQSAGRDAVMEKLQFTEVETPLVAQIWGMKPENYFKTAQELAKMGFASIDINMGCPVPKIIKLGACSALINDRTLAGEIINATKEGTGGKLPVSVKTRVGFNQVDMSWTQFLLEQDIAALIVHGRTSKQLSKVPNDWELIGRIREQRDEIAPQTVFIGNGDVDSRQQGMELAEKHQLDGIMIGRGIFKDPYVFAEDSPWESMSKQEKLELYKKHIRLFEETWGGQRNPASLKKFAKVYVSGFDGASDVRNELMQAENTQELLQVLEKY